MSIETLKIKVLANFPHAGIEAKPGDILDLPVEKALNRIDRDLAEPVIDLIEHLPTFSPNGEPVEKALFRYCVENPQLDPFWGSEDDSESQVRPTELSSDIFEVREFSSLPRWSKVWGAISKVKRSRVIGGVDLNSGWGYDRPSRGSRFPLGTHIPVAQRLREALRVLIYRRSIFRFIAHLRNGRLISKGVLATDFTSLEHKTIPAAFWRRDLVVHLRSGDIYERTPTNLGPGERIWTEVFIVMGDHEAKRNPNARGRPRADDWFLNRFRERVDQGHDILPTITTEAKYLRDSYNQEHPDKPLPAPKTVENKIRPEYNANKSKG
jgi:hypothetical protein